MSHYPPHTITLKLANGQVVRMRNLGTTDASVIGANKIWPTGANAASLNGGGITAHPPGTTIGQFEQYVPYLPHIEFGSPTRVADPTSAAVGGGDAASLAGVSHATSVAGVMIASGASAGAKGIAYQGSINAYTWVDPFGTVLSKQHRIAVFPTTPTAVSSAGIPLS